MHLAAQRRVPQHRAIVHEWSETLGALQARHQPPFIAVDLQRPLLPGTFEHVLNHLIDHELDLSGFDSRFNNNTLNFRF